MSSLLALWVWCAPSVVHAQTPETAAQDDQARYVFELGRRASADGRYEDAAGYYERAHRLSGRPRLLYNAGVARERAGQPELAVASFERYLAAGESLPRRAEVEERLSILSQAEPPSGARHVDRGGDDDPGSGPWWLVGSGAALAIAGGVSLFVADAAAAEVEGTPPGDQHWVDVADHAHDAARFSVLGGVLLAAGGALAASGLAWLLLSGERETRVALTPTGVAVGGTL